MLDRKFCIKHKRWPCADCGTSHYVGCDCTVCKPLTKWVPYKSKDTKEGRSNG